MKNSFYLGEDGAWVIQFGAGKIMVMAGHLQVGIGAVSFLGHRKIHAIGMRDSELEKLAGCPTDEVGDDYISGARLVFTDPKSIDVIIEALQETKRFMLEKVDLTLLKKPTAPTASQP